MFKNLFGKSKNENLSSSDMGVDYSTEYNDIKGWKLEIDTSNIHDFSILDLPYNLNFYLENWSHNVQERTSKKLEVLPGKVLEFWTLPHYSHLISSEVIESFKAVFKQTQTNKGDTEDYWERTAEIETEILDKYLHEIKELVYQFDHTNYGYNMFQIQSKYETVSLRGGSGYQANWGTQHTFDKSNEKREFIKFEVHNNGEQRIEWIPIEDRKLYLFDNPVTNVKEGFIIRKNFPEESQIQQYERVAELLGVAQSTKLSIKTKYHQF